MPESERLSRTIARMEANPHVYNTTAVEPVRAFRVGDRVQSKYSERTGTVKRVGIGEMDIDYDNGDTTSSKMQSPSCFTLVHPADNGEPAWRVGDRVAHKDNPGGEGVIVSMGWSDGPERWTGAEVEWVVCGLPGWGGRSEHWLESLTRIQGAAEPTIADGKAVLPKPPSAPLPDLSLTNEVGFPTMPPRTTSAFDEYVRNISPDVDSFVAHQEAVTTQAYTAMAIPKPPPRDDVAAYLASRKEPTEPEHVYREGDRVVASLEEGLVQLVVTVARYEDKDAVCIGPRGPLYFYSDELRPATSREIRTGKVES